VLQVIITLSAKTKLLAASTLGDLEYNLSRMNIIVRAKFMIEGGGGGSGVKKTTFDRFWNSS
jgi:hypothetical protein